MFIHSFIHSCLLRNDVERRYIRRIPRPPAAARPSRSGSGPRGSSRRRPSTCWRRRRRGSRGRRARRLRHVTISLCAARASTAPPLLLLLLLLTRTSCRLHIIRPLTTMTRLPTNCRRSQRIHPAHSRDSSLSTPRHPLTTMKSRVGPLELATKPSTAVLRAVARSRAR